MTRVLTGPYGQALDRRGALVCCERARHVTDAKGSMGRSPCGTC